MITGCRPTRAILNFAHRCAMNCEWCYVPFTSPPAHKSNVFSIVDRIADLGFTSITIGGGDPFQYRFAFELMRKAKSRGLFVHVDTHGKSLLQSEENLSSLASFVDLLGLPLDGSVAAVHDLMRSTAGHFDLVQRRLRWLFPLKDRIKVNTIVSATNSADIHALASLISSYEPARWSIYQYWPIGPGAAVKEKYSLSDDSFARYTENVDAFFENQRTFVEVNARESRRDTYPIIHHDGQVFIHSRPPENSFTPLGTIFDADILMKIEGGCSSERVAAVSRYVRSIQKE